MKYSALAPANIAFLKYWGKTNDALRLPANSSFSMNLSDAFTVTTVEFSTHVTADTIEFVDDVATEKEKNRIIAHLNVIRGLANISLPARVQTKNSFPKGTGVASSASGFAALSVAASNAAGLSLSEKELSILARRGSGSACRSIPDGFVVWEKGDTPETSFAHSVAPPDYWDVRDILCIVDSSMKKISTSDGHANVWTSPLWSSRLDHIEQTQSQMMNAFFKKDFSTFGQLVEDECLSMHTVMQSQVPPLFYWNDATAQLMKHVALWRTQGLSVYYTIDAGANVHIICEAANESRVRELAASCSGVVRIVVNRPSRGAHIVDTHLF